MMPKNPYLKGNPRKFSDKIALIKQNEALSDASFKSAIHGLTDIAKHNIVGRDIDNMKLKGATKNCLSFVDTLADNYSNNSYSPESYSSESTALSFKTANTFSNDNREQRIEGTDVYQNNEVFNSCHDLSERSDIRQNQSYRDEVKFRHGSGRLHLQSQETRYSNIEGYYPHNKNLSRLSETVTSGSMPDVSMWNNPHEFPTGHLNGNKFQNSNKRDHIDLQETLSNLEQVKHGNNSKTVLMELLKNRSAQNIVSVHPHHIPSLGGQTLTGLTTIISSPSHHRPVGQYHDHQDSDCAGNIMESGHLKHYSASNSPYLSHPHRDRHNVKDMDQGYRPRHISGNVNGPMKYMKLNINCCNDNDGDNYRNKALTPTGYQSDTWFDTARNDGNNRLLQPPMFPSVLAHENWRRVASDSSIQNSLKHQSDQTSQSNNLNAQNDSMKLENTYSFLRNQSMTSYHVPNNENIFNFPSKIADFQRESSQISISSSFMDNLLGLKSPDENMDPSLVTDVNIFKTPDIIQGQTFTFNEPQEIEYMAHDEIEKHDIVPDDYVATVNSNSYMDTCDREIGVVVPMSCDDHPCSSQSTPISNKFSNSHECYWEQSDDIGSAYTKEPSPKIKPCENIDPNDVIVDIDTDFAGIHDIDVNDVDVQRRHSFNWTDEVLKNLTGESANSESSPMRDRKMSAYQPMLGLAEEDVIKTLSDE